MNKPTKPNITIPEAFAVDGIKTDFTADKLQNGFDRIQPDVLAGDNLNKFIDDTYKGLNYGMAAADAINLINEGETLTVQNGQLVSGSTGSGLELCDIGMALYVDETKGLRRYLNGQIVDINTNTQAFLNRLKEITTLHPSLLCTEEEWQTAKAMSTFGQVGKFVFNYSGDEIVSVRLPRVVNVQGLFDLQNLGMTVSAGLPNITGSLNSSDFNIQGYYIDPKGAFQVLNGSKETFNAGRITPGFYNGLSFDASLSNPIYGNSNTVQPEAIQYPYFIQIATGSETENNIINDIELNNPYSLFDSKYSDHELNNLSWLKSEGQWNAKAVYPTAYDKLLKVYNGTETVEGLSVKLSTEEYTDYDFVLNTADETFRLPLLDGSEDLNGTEYELITPDGNGNEIHTAPYNCTVSLQANSTGVNQQIALENRSTRYMSRIASVAANNGLRVFLKAKRGQDVGFYYSTDITIIHMKFCKDVGNGSLYFYVGETVQNANLIDAGRIGEVLATKTDMLQASGAGMPSNKYIDLTLGASGSTYTAPANGYFCLAKTVEVGQYIAMYGTGRQRVITAPGVLIEATGTLPVKKDDTIEISYTGTGAVTVFRFIYAEGSK